MSALLLTPLLVTLLGVDASPTGTAGDPSQAVITGVAVDEAGRTVAGAAVRVRQYGQPDAAATTAADGRFRLTLAGPLANYRSVYARTPDGARQGCARTSFMNFGPVVDVRLTLKPSVTVRIEVVDAAGKPVPGAAVALDDDNVSLDHGLTDDRGLASFRVPADAHVQWVVGLKSGVGFDYFENYRAWPPPEPMPVPAGVRLVLDGARTVRMRATDSADRPLAGIPFYPILVGKKDKIGLASTGFLICLADGPALPRSGADGVAVCDWFPPALKRATPFNPVTPGYHCPAPPYIDQSNGEQPEPAQLFKVVACGGKVMRADGSPAPGVLVQAEGRGYTNHYCRAYARTGADGTYRLDLYPDQGYVVAVLGDDGAAPSLTGIVIREGRPRTDLDFRLGPGVLIEGRVTAGPKNAPAAGETVYLKQAGAPLPEELGKAVPGYKPELVRWAMTDADGRYRVRVGPGVYQFAGPDMKFSEWKVGTGAAVDYDFHLPRLPRGPFEVVVRKPDGSPAAGVVVSGNALGDARTDADGRFRGTRNRDPMLLYAHDPAGNLAGFAVVGPDDERADLTLKPASGAVGRVVAAGGRPHENATVTCIVRSTANAGDTLWVRLGTYSERGGRFKLTGLAEGVTCQLIVCDGMRCGVKPVKEFAVTGATFIDLGDVALAADEK